MEEQSVFNHIPSWIEKNEGSFTPPVCNKLMHGPDGQLFVMYVGGPNQRKDFHLEEGEELFYMEKGDMCLVVLEHGVFRDVIIKEGELFLLPGRILHSPQRFHDTMGLVIERQRLPEEQDCIRYFMENSTESLFERWMHCTNLGTQIAPIIREFFASTEHKTGKLTGSSVTQQPAFQADAVRSLEKPINLQYWLKDHEEEIKHSSNGVRIFDENYQSDILAIGGNNCVTLEKNAHAERWIWQYSGRANVELCQSDDSDLKRYFLGEKTCLLVPIGKKAIVGTVSAEKENSISIVVTMDPFNKKRVVAGWF